MLSLAKLRLVKREKGKNDIYLNFRFSKISNKVRNFHEKNAI